jgi:hypothetical protein
MAVTLQVLELERRDPERQDAFSVLVSMGGPWHCVSSAEHAFSSSRSVDQACKTRFKLQLGT